MTLLHMTYQMTVDTNSYQMKN